MTRFEKMEGYPEEIQGRFNSFITTQFDDSLSVEMQIRSLIKWISSSRDLINDIVDYINLFIEMFDERLQQEIVGRLNEWLADGTLAQIINDDVFDMKADKIFVDSEIERLEQKDEDLTTHVDSEIERLDQKDEDLDIELSKTIKVIKVENFGAVADGVTDDSNALQQAIDSAGVNGGVIQLMDGVHYLSETVEIEKDNITILGSNDTWLDGKDNHNIDGLIKVSGKINRNIPINIDLKKGETTAPTTLNSEYVIINTSENKNNKRVYYKKGEIVRVEGNTFVDALSDDYKASGYDLTIREIEPVKNFKLIDVNVKKDYLLSETSKSKAIVLEMCVDSTIENINGKHFDHAHVYVDRCYNVNINNFNFSKGNQLTGLSYGVVVANANRFITIENGTGKQLRHVTSFGSSGYGMPRHCLVDNVSDSHSYTMSFDIHNIAEHITYSNCVGESVSFEGYNNTFNNCVFTPSKYGEPFFMRISDTSNTIFNNCLFDGIVGFSNRSDLNETHSVTYNNCEIILNDTNDFANTQKFNNVVGMFNNTIIKSNIEPTVNENNVINNKKLIEMSFGSGSSFFNTTFQNLNNPLHIYRSHVHVKNCKFKQTYGYEISINTDFSITRGIEIVGNSFYTDKNFYSGAGRSFIRVYGSRNAGNNNITDNNMYTLQQLKKGMVLDKLGRSNVSNNTICVLDTGIELDVGTYQNVISGNSIDSIGKSIIDSGPNNVLGTNWERTV